MEAPFPAMRETAAGVELELLVQPRASRSAVTGCHDGRLKVSLPAPPVDGEANEALVRLLSDWFERPRRDVRLVRGASGRRKTVAIDGLSVEQASEWLKRALP